eukprot:5050058-Pyramimonas_sp.AAC.2
MELRSSYRGLALTHTNGGAPLAKFHSEEAIAKEAIEESRAYDKVVTHEFEVWVWCRTLVSAS